MILRNVCAGSSFIEMLALPAKRLVIAFALICAFIRSSALAGNLPSNRTGAKLTEFEKLPFARQTKRVSPKTAHRTGLNLNEFRLRNPNAG